MGLDGGSKELLCWGLGVGFMRFGIDDERLKNGVEGKVKGLIGRNI